MGTNDRERHLSVSFTRVLWQLGDWLAVAHGLGAAAVFLTKAVPLAISRGTTASVVRLELSICRDGLIGRGETGGFETGHRAYSTDAVEHELQQLLPQLEPLDPLVPQTLEPLLQSLSPPARCAVDLALWDWRAQCLQQPVWRLWGWMERALFPPA